MQCEAVAEALPRLLAGSGRAERQLVRHVETCLRCQAELARHRRMQRLLGPSRTQHPSVPPGGSGSAPAAVEERAGREPVRSALRSRRLALVGVGALASGAGLAVAALLAGRGRSPRAAGAPWADGPSRARIGAPSSMGGRRARVVT